MHITRKLKGLLWNAEAGVADPRAGDAPEDELSDRALAALAAEAAAKLSARPASVTPPPAVPSSPAVGVADAPPADFDFAAIYARTDSSGDPRVDQVLTAFEAMKAAMPAPQLAVAIGATAKAIGADPPAIVATLTQRLSALDTTVADERRKASEREAARTAELEVLTRKVQTEIEAMEHKITAFRRQLGAATETVQQRTAGERGVIAAFGSRARGEADRLKALRDFLAPPGTTPATDKPGKP
jgi:hypothetical protein